MPINPSIPLGVEQAPLIQTPEQRLSSQTAQLELQERQRDVRDRMQLRGILAKYGGDWEKAQGEISALNPTLGLSVRKSLQEAQTQTLEFQSARLRHHAELAGLMGRLAGSVDGQEGLDTLRMTIQAESPQDAARIPAIWDPASTPQFIEGLKRGAMTAEQQFQAEEKRLKDKRDEAALARQQMRDFAIEQGKQAELARKENAPIKLAAGDTLVDPKTYQPIASGTGKTLATTEAALDARFQELEAKVLRKQPLTADEQAELQAYKTRKTLVPSATFNMNAGTRADAQANRDDARADRSYQARNAELTTLRKPLADQADRLNRLTTTVNQMTPQADALIAPELLTVMAGGAGSGLRMNEAEIQRVVGGRSNWESLKARLNQWSLDPTKALTVTMEQRQEMRALIREVQQRSSSRLKLLDDATTALIDAPDIETQRRIVAGAKRALDVGDAPASPTVSAPTSGGLTYQDYLRSKGQK